MVRKQRKALTKELKKSVFMAVLGRVVKGALSNGAFTEVAVVFDLSPRTVSSLWHSILKMIPNMQTNAPLDAIAIAKALNDDMFQTYFQNGGRKRVYDPEEVLREIENVPLNKRRSVRSTAGAMGISKSTIARLIKEKKLKAFTLSLKPKLSDDHLSARLDPCLSKIDMTSLNGVAGLKYTTMYNEIHLDEKWFYLVQEGARYYLLCDELPPTKSVQHKSHITKVMFLSAVARPRFLPHDKQWFDGLIGIYPVGDLGAYQRNTAGKHRAGDPKWVDQGMTRERYRSMLLEQVLPDIKAKMPMPANNKLIIQQDGAKPHLLTKDPAFEQKVEELFGKKDAIQLYTQPAQSPDLNVNDLGFFNALQSHFYKHSPEDSLELIAIVKDAFVDFPVNKLNRIWLSLQQCWNKIIEYRGDNIYTMPHMNKEKLEREGTLPTVLTVTNEAFKYPPFVAG